MKNYMKEMVKPSHEFLYRHGPGVLVEVEFQRGLENEKTDIL